MGKLVTAKVGFTYVVTISGDLAWNSDVSLAFDTYNNLRWTGFDVPQNVTFFVQTSGDSGASGDLTAWQYADYYSIAQAYNVKLIAYEAGLDTGQGLGSNLPERVKLSCS